MHTLQLVILQKQRKGQNVRDPQSNDNLYSTLLLKNSVLPSSRWWFTPSEHCVVPIFNEKL